MDMYPAFMDTIPTQPADLDKAPRILREREATWSGIVMLGLCAGSMVFAAYWLVRLAAWVFA